jgi:hypothetical protein
MTDHNSTKSGVSTLSFSETQRTERDGQGASAYLSRVLVLGLVGFGSLSLVPTAAAHDGSTHAGTPHWVFLGITLLGVSIVGISLHFGRTRWANFPQRTIKSLLLGATIAMLGTIAVIQIQIEPIGTTPAALEWYPIFAGIVGISILTASLFGGFVRWPDRPRYALLGMLLGVWVLYPVIMPGLGYTNPLGYLLVVAVPLVIGYIFWRDVSPALSTVVVDPFSRRVGGIVAVLFTVFFLFSAGLFTVNPDEGVNAPTEAFVTIASFANPLVVWPAIEFYLPSIPLSGALSVGTMLVIGLLAALIGVNTALMTTVWQRGIELSSTVGAGGAVATTGATACCCCGPAVYAIASAILGVSASPLYWAFLAPSSPLGALFFVGAITLLTGSSIRLTHSLHNAGVCTPPGNPVAR